ECEIGQDAGFLDAEILADEAKILHCAGREFAAVAHIVAIGEDRQDQGVEDEADILPYLALAGGLAIVLIANVIFKLPA
ncbi:hypothetical protein ACC740_37485, partial [Rhizobium ruizarguesonis]